MRASLRTLLAAAGLAFAAGGVNSARAAATSDVPKPSLSALPAPVAHPYDSDADAHAAVDAAFKEAKRTGRNVLLDFGGNWCPDCRIMAGILEADAVRPWVAANFVPVAVDVGRYDKNMDIEQRFGIVPKGVPTVLVVTPDGKVLNPDSMKAMTDARHMSPQAVIDLLAAWNARG
jgi:thioredoxin 1